MRKSRRVFPTALVITLGFAVLSCGDNRERFEPEFAEDVNNLIPAPGVEAVSEAQANAAVVTPGQLSFPASQTDILEWQPGRVVVGAPGEGGSGNLFGFARRVKSVEQRGGQIIVTTEKVEIQDVVSGDFRMRLDQDAVPVDPWIRLQWMKRPGKNFGFVFTPMQVRRAPSTSVRNSKTTVLLQVPRGISLASLSSRRSSRTASALLEASL